MNIGMVSTRFAGLDGVSLEARKMAEALGQAGHTFSWFAGELDPEFRPGMHVPAAFFGTPENLALQAAIFGHDVVEPGVPRRLLKTVGELAGSLLTFVEDFGVDALVVQNALAIPMQLPLGLAIAEVVAASGVPTIGHHHDFGWERPRFARCALEGIVDLAFPPTMAGLSHVVINLDARDALFDRKGVEATVLPNVMDFERGPRRSGRGEVYRNAAGLSDDDVIFLQPTRVIRRKGIELTIELAHRLADPAIKVLVSHVDDLDATYWDELRALAEDRRVDLRLVPAAPGGLGDPRLADAYAAADLVCYPSLYEGFGNALLEAFFYRRPVLVNRYPVYRRDIAPTGVRCIEIDGAVDQVAVETTARWLSDPGGEPATAAEANYDVGRRHFSYGVLRDRILPLLG